MHQAVAGALVPMIFTMVPGFYAGTNRPEVGIEGAYRDWCPFPEPSFCEPIFMS